MGDRTEFLTERQQDIWSIQIAGELTKGEEDRFFQTSPWFSTEEGIRFILFDMNKLQYMNSAGISLLIRFVREAQKQQYETFAFGVSPHYQKIFRIVGLTSYMELFSDQYSAIETLRSRSDFERRSNQDSGQ